MTTSRVLLLAQCQTFDVIGSVGFGKLFNAAADLKSEGATSCHAVEQGKQQVLCNLLHAVPLLDIKLPHERPHLCQTSN